MAERKWGVKVIFFLISAYFLLWLAPAFAVTMTLLDENFNDVTGITADNGNGSTRTVQDILANNPGQLQFVTNPASVGSSPNVRRTNNTINTSAGAMGFDSFFMPIQNMDPRNLFLVIGDDEGAIGGTPSSGATEVRFSFTIPNNARSTKIAFDLSFDGTDTALLSSDSFTIRLLPAGGNTIDLRTLTSPMDFLSTNFNDTRNLAAGAYSLALRLEESAPLVGMDNTNTAVGIDNVIVTIHVPEPASFLLVYFGLVGLSAWHLRPRRAKRIEQGGQKQSIAQ